MKKKLILITFTLFCALFFCNCQKETNCDCGNEGFIKYNTETKKYDLYGSDTNMDPYKNASIRGIKKTQLPRNLENKTKISKVKYCVHTDSFYTQEEPKPYHFLKCIEKIE